MSDLGYDTADQMMEQADLEAKYGDAGHPVYSLAKYKEALSKNPELEASFNGYYDWVAFMTAADGLIQPEQPAQGMARVESLDQFAFVIGKWHANIMQQLMHMLDVPDGTPLEVNLDGVEETVVITGEARQGFRAALVAALSTIQHLPFRAASAEADNDAAPGQ